MSAPDRRPAPRPDEPAGRPQRPGHCAADELFAEIPPPLRFSGVLRLPPPLAESDLSARLLELATPNTHLDEAVGFLGGGAGDHYVPAVVDAIASAVGRQRVGPGAPQPLLQHVYELQQLFAALTALEVAAAPLPDGPMALVEAIRVALRATGRRQVIVARNASPAYRAIVRTMLAGEPVECREAGYHGGVLRLDEVRHHLSEATACLVVEHPSYFGCLEDLGALAAAAHRHGALLVAKVDPISLGLLAPPGEAGADIAVADGQPLGARAAFGSGSLGLLACRAALADELTTWRVVQRDGIFQATGEASWRLTADRVVRPVAYLAALGPGGLQQVARLCTRQAHAAQERVCSIEGFDRRFRASFFKEFVVESRHDPDALAEELMASNILGPLPLQPHYPEMDHCLLFAATERRTDSDIEMLCQTLEAFAEGLGDRD